ncbi:MAG TPA: 1-acyl-sn-glycerol-3-phosphate acyltransferase [Solirubrobacteraceae bacterium]|jgi:1-acyl-sn-glycerol-3-phosphate acyltransferase|nr:1-acyl-sn-glycerol-3-phosphate acyltransferase [Solirubrobacteraceae bacterium]
MDLERVHRRTRERGVSPVVYGIVRVLFQSFFHVYFRMRRIGREHIPRSGPVIIAANHRSFLDPFVIACMARRPMYYVAKKEIFAYRPVAWILGALGAFPVDRGAGDAESITTAKAILARGGIVLIFPEGTRTRPGALGKPKRGVGRLALETGAPVVPVAVIGTEAIRKGWRIRPHKVRIRAGRALRFPHVSEPSVTLAGAVTDRIWPCVMLQWEWLGGLAPLRRAAIIGAGARGTSLAICLANAGLEVDLGCRTLEQARALEAARENERCLPGVELPGTVRVLPAGDLSLETHDIVCFAVPAKALPAALAAHGAQISSHVGVVVVCEGLVPPLGALPCAFAADRCNAGAIAVLGGPATNGMLIAGASIVVASLDKALARRLADALRAADLEVSITSDVIGVQLASCGKNAAVLAAAAAAPQAGAAGAGAAAGKVLAEVNALARARGGRPETLAGLAGTGALVGAVVAGNSPNQRAGERLARGMPAADIGSDGADAVDSVSLLATAARAAHLEAPAIDGLAALIEGRIKPAQWAATVLEPPYADRLAEPAG